MRIVLGIITKGKKVLIGELMTERFQEFGGIKYVFPGGKVKNHEESEIAVEREIFEETGLRVDIINMIGKRVHPSTGKKIEYYHCNYVTGSLSTVSEFNDDIERLFWIESNEIEYYMPSIYSQILVYLKRINVYSS